MQTVVPTSIPQMLQALFGSEPFFGGQSAGRQRDSAEHGSMIAVVSLVTEPGRPIKVLQIGSGAGASTLSFAQAIRTFSHAGGTITCVDSWNTKALHEIDVAFDVFKHNTQSIAGDIALRSIRGVSGTILPTLEPASYDLIAIDASRRYSDILNDLGRAARLLRDGGIVCGHDLALQVDAINVAAARDRLADETATDSKTGRHFYPGVTLAVGEYFGRTISCVAGFWAVRKHAERFDDVSFAGLPCVVPRHLR